VKVNIIEYNSTPDSLFHKTDPTRRNAFIAVLEHCNMVVNIRLSKGQDIAAACGQLVKNNVH
jgi:23S rRNA (adenine2503-C2)-methyltransferase